MRGRRTRQIRPVRNGGEGCEERPNHLKITGYNTTRLSGELTGETSCVAQNGGRGRNVFELCPYYILKLRYWILRLGHSTKKSRQYQHNYINLG